MRARKQLSECVEDRCDRPGLARLARAVGAGRRRAAQLDDARERRHKLRRMSWVVGGCTRREDEQLRERWNLADEEATAAQLVGETVERGRLPFGVVLQVAVGEEFNSGRRGRHAPNVGAVGMEEV